jgi:chromosomal replication initiation ATPase DnaA
MSQFALPLAYRSADGESDFYVSHANADAVDWLDRWPQWPGRTLVIVGPAGSGKSHLCRMFARRVGQAVHIHDGADDGNLDEEGVFHAWNAAQDGSGGLLLAARAPPASWPIHLPDLRSRMLAAPIAEIEAPDENLLSEVAAKRFRDRGVLVTPTVINYMVVRIERSFAGLEAAVSAVDIAAMAGQRPVTIPLVRTALGLGLTEE